MPNEPNPTSIGPDEPNDLFIDSELTLDDVISDMYTLRESYRALDKQSKDIKAEYKELERLVIQRLDEAGVAYAGNELASATVSEEKMPNIDDWDAVCRYIADTNSWYLIKREILAGQFREATLGGEEIPGLLGYTKRKVALRKR
jgi:hypothetical protein